MRELSPRIAWYALLSVLIALILGACVQPVALKPFLGDDKVQGLIKNGVEFGWEVENPERIDPIVQVNGVEISEEDTVIVSLSSPPLPTIKVFNTDNYGGGVEWHFGDHSAVGFGDTLSLAPFTSEGTYPVTAVGKTSDDVPFSTLFYIKVEQ